MRFLIFTSRLVALLVLHAAGAGLASPTVLVSRPITLKLEWLPSDNQTLYSLKEGERRNLQLNTSSISQRHAFITINPCSRDFHWAFYHGSLNDDGLTLLKEHSGADTSVFSVLISQYNRYVIEISSTNGGAAAVSVRGEANRNVRMRLRVRSRRRLSANWEPSPIDPQATTYCVVASHRKNYTSLCAAQYDIKFHRLDNRPTNCNHEMRHLNPTQNGLNPKTGTFNPKVDHFNQNKDHIYENGSLESTEVDNKIDADIYNVYEDNFRSIYRRRKFGRSTTVTDEDPVIACVGDRTHHVIENLDAALTYFVSVFGVARDRRAGSLLATGSVRPRTSTAKRLRENVPSKNDIRSKTVYYFKTTVGSGGGVWMTISTCGGAVDLEVLVRGKRLYFKKNIEYHFKFFVPAPIPTSSIQETSDESSVQFDSSSEETKMRYVIRVTPSLSNDVVGVEITASTSRWGFSTPELLEDGTIVRELRPRRSCNSLDVAFLPATHNATDVIRYCITAWEDVSGESHLCNSSKKSSVKLCVTYVQTPTSRVIVQKITGLKPGQKYAIQVTASSTGTSIPYQTLYADTNVSCKDDVI
ncbi:uncharacterized protein LOC113231385 [Hyposmocoma kahamanoa]|uniref:uncharacterized protein LOC113231385 n=1 Tax=Hyposmocoma kahamanoa TaxID=1477025 RepID=UPI000E6D828F|nr:uncharacterized protein LOC113231385 [Hyposmocoma kahamanoa]